MTDKQIDKHIPRLRFPEFQCEGEWRMLKLRDVVSIVNDRSSVEDINIRSYISTENMLPDFSGVKEATKLPATGAFTRFKENDILFSNIRPYLKKVWRATFAGAVSNDILVFRTLADFDNCFVSQIIMSEEFISYTMVGAKGVKMPRGDKNMMLDYDVFIPPLPEQKKIAKTLSGLDELIKASNKKIEKLKAHKKSLMQKLFPQNSKTVPEYRFPEFEKDEAWTEKRLGDFLKVRSGYAFKSNTYITSGKFKIVTIRNVKKGRMEMGEYNTINTLPIDIQSHQILKRGNILVSMTGNVGRVCKVDCDNCLLNQRVGLIEKHTTTIDEDFVFTILTDACFEQAMIESGQGAAQANIGNKDIEDYGFLCPPSLNEQNQIASCLSPIESLTNYYMDKVSLLEQFRVGLIQQLFPKQQAL